MRMKQLEYLIKAVECGSISKAAQQLFVSQPSLTKSMMQLEEEYGIQLLIRKARGIELTAEGKDFVHYARGVLTAAGALESAFSPDRGVQESRLFLAMQQLDFVYDLLLKIYSSNMERRIHYNLVEADRSEVTRLVLSGEVDLGLMVRSSVDARTFLWHTEAKRLSINPLAKAGVYVCVGPGSPYYENKSITFSQAEKSFQVVLDMEPAAKQNLYFDGSSHHFNQEKIVFFNSISACERFLVKTDALLFIAKWAIGCFRDPRVRAIPVVPERDGELIPNNELLWIKRAGEPLSQSELQFVHHLYQHFDRPEPEVL